MNPVIEISDLTVTFNGSAYRLTALDDVHLSIRSGETVAIIGESGSGKSVLGLSILGLLPDSAEVSGTIRYEGMNLVTATYHELERIRGGAMAWIPQNPKTGFNPSMKMWKQITEPQVIHTSRSWSSARQQAKKLLEQFRILPAEEWAEAYPITYSGGMLQRAMVAMGISADPRIIIADEPTKGIDQINKTDVTEIFAGLKEKEITQILITHDLDFAAALADRIVVIYCGEIVEIAGREQFFSSPRHPYSRALLKSLPQNGLTPIPGSSPPLHIAFTGCRYRDRCEVCREECSVKIPFMSVGNDYVRCISYDNRIRDQ